MFGGPFLPDVNHVDHDDALNFLDWSQAFRRQASSMSTTHHHTHHNHHHHHQNHDNNNRSPHNALRRQETDASILTTTTTRHSSSNHVLETTVHNNSNINNGNNHGNTGPSKQQSQPHSHSYTHAHSPNWLARVKRWPYDTRLLHRVVADAGRWAYGTVLVEVWALSDDRTHLFRPEAGWWVDPVFHNEVQGHVTGGVATDHPCQICRLTDGSRQDYIAPQTVFPGQGLAGVLWSEASSKWTRTWRETLVSKILGHSDAPAVTPRELYMDVRRRHHKVVWRNVRQLEEDSDQPWNPRLKLFLQLGLGWAAAVPFNVHDHEGVVIYMARDHVDMNRLQSETNHSYLMAASDLIGAAYTLRRPRNAVVRERHSELATSLRKVRHGILKAIRQGKTLRALMEQSSVISSSTTTSESTSTILTKPTSPPEYSLGTLLAGALHSTLAKTMKKCRGGGAQPPPAMPWSQTMVTFLGALLTLFVITSVNLYMVNHYGHNYSLLLGPLGAFVTLLFGLTSAPASQPRNAILGQAVSISIAMSFSYATALPFWLRQSLGTALAITAMVKLDLTHPPAGAAALIFSSQPPMWGCLTAMLFIDVLAILCGALLNNLSDKRQYPSYWGVTTALRPIMDDFVEPVQTALEWVWSSCWKRRKQRRAVGDSHHTVDYDLNRTSGESSRHRVEYNLSGGGNRTKEEGFIEPP